MSHCGGQGVDSTWIVSVLLDGEACVYVMNAWPKPMPLNAAMSIQTSYTLR